MDQISYWAQGFGFRVQDFFFNVVGFREFGLLEDGPNTL